MDSRRPAHRQVHPCDHQGQEVLVLRYTGWAWGYTRRYVGPADDPDIAQRVADHKRDKDDLRARRRMVNSLTCEGGMIAPDNMSGDIVEALAEGGLFRLGASSPGRWPSNAIPVCLGFVCPWRRS